MEKSIGLSSQFVMALALVAMFTGASVCKGDARQSQKPAQSSAATQANANQKLPESAILMQHDDVVPTQNRTQAMAIEAENGKLPQGEEDELKRRGLIKHSY